MLVRVAMAILVSGLLIPAAARSADDAIDPKGKPTSYKAGSGKYAIWYDTEGWHFRATAAKDGQTFTGRIDAVDGQFVGMRNIATTAKGPKTAPGKMLDIKSKGFDVKFTMIKGSENGFDLKLDDKVTEIKFSLKIDDKADAETILIGAKGAHPNGGEFSLPAKPAKK
jgi:hypothetical protein